MSGQATGWVLRHGPGRKDRAAHAVLVTIADAANADGDHAHPGIPAMVQGSGYSRATVFDALRRLLDAGYVEIEEEGGGRGKATVYRLPGVLDTAWKPRPQTVQFSDPSGTPNGPETVQAGEPNSPETVQTSAGAPHIATPTDTNGDARAKTVEETFDLFWAIWPARGGRKLHKGEALKLWKRMTLEERRAAYRGAKNYATACENGTQGAMDPDRWLRRKEWPDWQEHVELAPARRGRGSDGTIAAARELRENEIDPETGMFRD